MSSRPEGREPLTENKNYSPGHAALDADSQKLAQPAQGTKSPMQFFRVKNLEKHQHYKNRAPVWIKLYSSILDDFAFANLPDTSKFHLIAIWILASKNENRIPFCSKWIKRRTNCKRKVDLSILQDAGFIEIIPDNASKPLASRKQTADTEKRREEGGGAHRANAKPPSSSSEQRKEKERAGRASLDADGTSRAVSLNSDNESGPVYDQYGLTKIDKFTWRDSAGNELRSPVERVEYLREHGYT